MARRKSRRREVSLAALRHARTRMYVRESTERQAGPDHYGPDLQRAGIAKFCADHELAQPQHEYFDAASGRSIHGRSQLQRAIEDGERGEYDLLLVYHSSRSFRNSTDAKLVKRRLNEAAVTLIFTSQSLISGDPHRKVEEGFVELMDELRSDEQAMFISSGLRQKFERGLHNGMAPLGYERIHGAPHDPQNKELRVVGVEAGAVRRIYELYATGRYSELDVALALNAEATEEGSPVYRTKRGRPFTEGGVREILGNRVYTGVIVWHPGTPEEEVRQGRHEPIIEAALFDQVQQVKQQRTRWRGRRPVARAYPLSRRSFCQACGASIAGDTGGKNNYRRMRHGRTGRCPGWVSHPAERLEAQMGELLSSRLTLPSDWERQVRKLLAQPSPDRSVDAHAATRLQTALEQLRKQHTWGDISDEQYLTEKREIERKRAELEPRGGRPTEMLDVGRAGALLKDLGRLWGHTGVSGETKKQFIQEAFERIEIDELGIRTVQFAENLLPAVAVAMVGGNGAGDGSLPLENHPHVWTPARVEILGIRPYVERLSA